MSELARVLTSLAEREEGALMPFLVAGDPDFHRCLEMFGALDRAGADIFELGFPFSDPVADGPVIQAADRRALAAGMNTNRAFELLDVLHDQYKKPIVLLLYYNLVLQYGVDEFYRRAADAGVRGILAADVPLEHADEILGAAKAHGIDPIFIASERSSDERLGRIGELGAGFVYTVARLGVTGDRPKLSSGLGPLVERVKQRTGLPALAGFGISTPAQVRSVLDLGADGAIVGSAIVRRIQANLKDTDRLVEDIEAFVGSLKRATGRDPTC